MLELTAAGGALDLPTFRAVMREWIAHCQWDGASQSAEELDVTGGPRVLTAALDLEGYGGERESVTLDSRSIEEELERSNQHLASQNATLRCALESAEELNAQLAEEVAGLTAQLHRSGGTHSAQQALEHGGATSQKLEDLEDEVRRLQEEKRGLTEQNQRLEREKHGLVEEVTGLQETNSTLLAEAKGRKENLQALEAKKDAILQMEISSLHKLLRQTLEAVAM
ncbi:protein KASH5-like [Cygnus olor]|uniref:protein KASH5-like n=1 Tax=Cygnus olor TaxID=8869 RepID=UPI001ADE65AF|nr:protein KASH5-like [Cygnus olor]